MDNKIKLNCILYSLNLVKILTVENQSNKEIYNQFYKLYQLLEKNEWIKSFLFWELQIIKLVGYDINFNDYVDKKKIKDNQSYISTIDGAKEIPLFLINSDFHEVNNQVLKDGFKIVGDFLNKTVLIPNNINYPVARNEFIKLI